MTDLALEPAEITAPFVILSEGQWPDVPTDWPWHSHPSTSWCGSATAP